MKKNINNIASVSVKASPANLVAKTVAIQTVKAAWQTVFDAIVDGEGKGFTAKHARFIFNRASEVKGGKYASLLKSARNLADFEYKLCNGFAKKTAVQECRHFLVQAVNLSEGKTGQNLDARKRQALAIANHEAAKQLLAAAKAQATTKAQFASLERLEQKHKPTDELSQRVEVVYLVKKPTKKA